MHNDLRKFFEFCADKQTTRTRLKLDPLRQYGWLADEILKKIKTALSGNAQSFIVQCVRNVLRTIVSLSAVQTSARAATIKKISRLDYDWINEVVVEGLASRLLSSDGITREDPTTRGDKRWGDEVFVAQARTSLVVAYC